MSGWNEERDQPHAEVQRVGRWTYRVSVVHGLTCYGPGGSGWHVLGRRRAERKAARVLARYLRDQARQADITRLEAP
jgi:hypothetical protein